VLIEVWHAFIVIEATVIEVKDKGKHFF